MKKILLLLIILGLVSCKDRQPDPNVLPEATQTGANTGGALVDGKVWVAKIEQPNLTPGGNNTKYEYSNNKYKLKITLRQVNNWSSVIAFYLEDTDDFTITTYNLDEGNFRGSYSVDSLQDYFTDNIQTGILTITKFDKTNKIICGRFSFKAKNSSGEIVTITEGRFDKKFL